MFNLVNFSSSDAAGDSRNTVPSNPQGANRRSRRRRKMKNKQKVEPMSKVQQSKRHDAPMTKNDLYFALDCEMVGIGPDGFDSAVARVTIINWEKEIVLDTYVKVPVPVTDFRTYVSGIRPEDIESEDAMAFDEARTAVEKIIRGKILIGHGLECDLGSLGLSHPWCDVRDTATYGPYMREVVDYENGKLLLRPRKLRDLAWEALGKQIQDDGMPHSPIEDAGAALDLYKAARQEWEEELRRQQASKFEQIMAPQQRKTRSSYWNVSMIPSPIQDATFSANLHGMPYQAPYDPSIYNGPYEPEVPSFSPLPEVRPVVVPPEPRRQSSRRWFSRSKSPDKDRQKECLEEGGIGGGSGSGPPQAPARPASPRPSSLFASFRFSSASKRVVQQSVSMETATTSGTDFDKLEEPTWDYIAETADWSENVAGGSRNEEAKVSSSRLFKYLSLDNTGCDDEDVLEVFEDIQHQQGQEWQSTFYGDVEWSTSYNTSRK